MSASIWVGEDDERLTYVYDTAIQIPECPHIFLWEIKPGSQHGEMGKYDSDTIRKHIKPIKDLESSNRYIFAYEQWRNSKGNTWQEEQIRFYAPWLDAQRKRQEAEREAERVSKLTPEERHKERLEKLGIEYRGVRPASKNTNRWRVTHCYACGIILDNQIDIECKTCNWILCECGACGCGY